MNVLFVHEVDWLNKVVFEIHNLAEILSKNHKVFAIDYEENWKKESFFDMGTLKTREFKHVSRAYNGADVTVRRPGMIKLPLLSTFSAFFTHYREIKKTIKEENIDAIVLYSAPTNGLQTLHIAKKYNIPVIFRSIDILNQLVPQWFLRAPTRIIERDVSWDEYSLMSNAIMRTEELDYDDLERAIKLAYRKFYWRLSYILRRASKLRPDNIRRNVNGFRMFLKEVRG